MTNIPDHTKGSVPLLAPDRGPAARLRTTPFLPLVLFALYLLSAVLGFRLSIPPRVIASFWPASGVLLAFLLATELQRWPGLIGAAIAAEVAVNLGYGHPVLLSGAFALLNTMSVLAGAWAVRRLIEPVDIFRSTRSMLVFLLAGALIPTVLSASVGTGLSIRWLHAHGFGDYWFLWWSGDLLGILSAAPLILAGLEYGSRLRLSRMTGKLFELILILLAISVLAWNSYVSPFVPALAHRSFFFIPLLWAAFRTGPGGLAVASSWVVLLSTRSLVAQSSVFVGAALGDIDPEAAHLQLALAVNLATTLLAGAALWERERSREDLKRNERQFRLLADNAQDVIYRYRFVPTPGLEYISPSVERITGYAPQELLGSDALLRIIHPADRAQLLQSLSDPERHREPETWRWITRSGETIWVEHIDSVIRDGAGNPVGTQGVARDVTERVRAAEEIRVLNAKLQAVIDASPVAIIMADREGVVRDVWNPAAERIFGWTREEVLDQPLPYPSPAAWAELRRLQTEVFGGQTIMNFETTRLQRSGTAIDVNISVAPIRNAEGAVAYAIAVVADVTDRKRAEAKLQQTQMSLRRLASRLEKAREEQRASIAREVHDELGQLLTAMKMDLLSLLRAAGEGRERVVETARSMLELIEAAVKSVQRISAELRPALLDDLGLSAAIEWQVEEFRRHTGIACDLSLPAQELRLGRDKSTALFRILQEGLTNVTRHARATQSRVSLSRDGGIVILEIGDNGVGIAEEQIHDPQALGIVGIRERLMAWSGELSFRRPDGGGTVLSVRVPDDGHTEKRT